MYFVYTNCTIIERNFAFRETGSTGISQTEVNKRKSTDSLPARPFLSVTSPLNLLDKAVSHPNISSGSSSLNSPEPTSPSSIPPLSVSTLSVGSFTPSAQSPADEWVKDIDSAMERVMSEIDSLQKQTSRERLQSDSQSTTTTTNSEMTIREKRNSTFHPLPQDQPLQIATSSISTEPPLIFPLEQSLNNKQETELQRRRKSEDVSLEKRTEEIQAEIREKRLSKSHTPDLVLDLPITRDPPSPHSSSSDSSPTMSTAEVFANASNSTIKKSASIQRHSSLKLRPNIPAEFVDVKLSTFGLPPKPKPPQAKVDVSVDPASKSNVNEVNLNSSKTVDTSYPPWRPASPQFGTEQQPTSHLPPVPRKVPPTLKPKPSVRIKPQILGQKKDSDNEPNYT